CALALVPRTSASKILALNGPRRLRPEGVVGRLVRVVLHEVRELPTGDRERKRLVLVERLATPLALVAVDGDDRVVARYLRALELRREGAVAELEQLAVVGEDVVDALVFARERAVARRAVDGVGGEE